MKTADMLHEFSKPLARAKDDADLDDYLKAQDRAGDPMLKFLKKKDKKRTQSKNTDRICTILAFFGLGFCRTVIVTR